MRARKRWGILGSAAGFASSTAAFSYFAVVMLAMTTPSITKGASSCITYEIALAIAMGTEAGSEDIYMESYAALAHCMMGTGPCTTEEINVALATGYYEAAVEIRQEAEADLQMCQAFSGP